MSFTHLLTDTVTIAEVASRSNSGDPTFAAQTTRAARVELSDKTFRDNKGEEQQASHVVVTEAAISRNARVWLPGADTANANAGRQVIASKSASRPDRSLTLVETFVS